MLKLVRVVAVVCCTAIVVFVVGVLTGYWLSSYKGDKGQIVVAMIGVLVTVAYVAVTFETLQVLRQQVENQKATACRFGLIRRDGKVYVWVANLGFSTFLVTSIHFFAQANSSLQESTHMHRTVAMGERKLFLVPEGLYVHAVLRREIAVQIRYVGLDEKEHCMRREFVLLVSEGTVVKITKAQTAQQAKGEWGDSQ
jgi:hypothetical protein